MEMNHKTQFIRYSEVINKVLISIENFDFYTKEHCERVGIYTTLFMLYLNETGWTSEVAGLTEQDIKDIIYSAFIHDVGKINVHADVIRKERKLTEQEWLEVKDHPMNGAFFFQGKNYERIKDCILTHHEKYNGTGYPLGLSGEEIPIGGRIISILDSFDAMTDKRPYATREPMDLEEALKEIEKCSGTQFDPILTTLFVKMCRESLTNILELKKSKEDVLRYIELFYKWIQNDDYQLKISTDDTDDSEEIIKIKKRGDFTTYGPKI